MLLIFYLFSVIYSVFMPLITEKTKLPSSLNNQLPAFISYFVSGMFFFLNFDKVFSKLHILVIPSVVIFVLCFIFKIPVVSNLFEPITLCIILMWLAFNLKIFDRITSKYDYSYTIYLIHYPLIMTFTFLRFYENLLLGFSLTLLSTMILSVFFEKFQKKIIR